MAKKNTRNTRDPDNILYRILTKIFSGPITQFRAESPAKLRRQQLDKYKFRSLSGHSFKKNSYNAFDMMNRLMRANIARNERYNEFNEMDTTPEIHAALDIYADGISTSSTFQKVLKVKCPNDEIKTILEELFYKVLNIEHNIFSWARSMCKFGDYFLYIDTDEKLGVKKLVPIAPEEIEVLEGEDPTNPYYVQYQWNSGGLTFERWQVAHFKISGDHQFLPYGVSILDGARRVFRQLQLQEDAMMAYRIVRSPERRVFYVDVAGIAANEVEQHMEAIMTNTKRNQIVDPNTGLVEQRYNPMSVDEDYYIAVRGEKSGTKIETLQGGAYTGDIDDVLYLQNKVLTALKIPRSYLIERIASEGGSDDKTTLAQKDIQFAKSIQRLQQSVVSELRQIAMVHLIILGFRGNDLTSFELSLNNPSKISELQELEHWRTKFDVAQAAVEGFFSKRWIAKNILGLSEEEFERNIIEMFSDRKIDHELESIAEFEGGDGAAGDLSDLGGDLSGGADEPAAEEEDGTLLAAPGKRHDGQISPGAKGKVYFPVQDDKRDMGARVRSYHGQYSKESASNTVRNVFKGYPELKTLSKGIYENKKTIYENKETREESDILENNENIKYLIESLEKTFNGDKNGKV